jgi:hypothetical protein
MAAMGDLIANVLGAERAVVRTYEDGSYDCPWCSHPVVAPASACVNPWCVANPRMPVAYAERVEATERKRREEEERRQRDSKAALERIQEGRTAEFEWRERARQEARRRGTCTRYECLFRPGGKLRFVKHRGGVCPNWGK